MRQKSAARQSCSEIERERARESVRLRLKQQREIEKTARQRAAEK